MFLNISNIHIYRPLKNSPIKEPSMGCGLSTQNSPSEEAIAYRQKRDQVTNGAIAGAIGASAAASNAAASNAAASSAAAGGGGGC
ncbi:hypothetical protein LTR95_003282 [Oleoguttula sp. CCFEE 5521]